MPIAHRDMVSIAEYISSELSNPAVAEELAGEMIASVDDLSEFPYIYPAYVPIRPLKYEYRKLLVRNYIVLYWVDEEKKIVTVASVLYAKKD